MFKPTLDPQTLADVTGLATSEKKPGRPVRMTSLATWWCPDRSWGCYGRTGVVILVKLEVPIEIRTSSIRQLDW